MSGVRIPIVTAGIRLAAEFGLLNGLGGHSDCVGAGEIRTAEISVADPSAAAGEDRLLQTGLPGCPYRFL